MDIPELAASNQERLRNLAAKGVTLDPLQLLKMRLDMLTDWFFADDDVLRSEFEGTWEEQIAAICDEAERQIARQILLEGVK